MKKFNQAKKININDLAEKITKRNLEKENDLLKLAQKQTKKNINRFKCKKKKEKIIIIKKETGLQAKIPSDMTRAQLDRKISNNIELYNNFINNNSLNYIRI